MKSQTVGVLGLAFLAVGDGLPGGGARGGSGRRIGSDEPSTPLAIVGVGIVMLQAERVIEEQTVVVGGGRIQAIGPTAEVRVPEGASRVDGRGRFVMPGLADMHVHLFNSRDLALYVANGITTIRNLGGYEAADSILRIRQEVRDGQRLGPTIYTSGNWLDGDPPFRPENTVVRTPQDAERVVAQQAAAGYEFIKVYVTLRPEVYRAIVEAARRRSIPVTGHVPAAVGIDDVLASGQIGIDHLGQYPLSRFGQASGDSALEEFSRRTSERGVSVTTTLVMLQRSLAMRGNPEFVRDLLAGPEARYLSPATREFWMRAPFLSQQRLPTAGAVYGQTQRLAARLHAHDVRLLLGTDAGLWGNPPGFSAIEELRLLVESGLTPAQALWAATLAPAAFLNQYVPGADQPGEVRVGMRADLLVLEQNPLTDVSAVSRKVGVVLRGRWIPEAELQALLEGLASDYARSAPP
ncbi:MAG: amidohydrolase family protein [Gemmatimonadales bacterium]